MFFFYTPAVVGLCRREQLEKGRRRKEESERRQRELAIELQRQNEAEQAEKEVRVFLLHFLSDDVVLHLRLCSMIYSQ